MSACTSLPTCQSPDHLAGSFRAVLHSEDALGMLYAETYASRRDLLPHEGDVACLLDAAAAGCDGLCSLAITAVIDDLVGYYRRQVGSGRIGTLANPGGYARSLVRLRSRDVISTLTRPVGGYARPQRLADARTRPAYLGLDDTDGRLLASAIAYLRSETTATDVETVNAYAQAACRRAGLDIAEDDNQLQRIINALLAAGGRATTFVQREVLDLLAARSTRSLDGVGGDGALGRHEDMHAAEERERVADALQLREIIDQVEQQLAAHGGWQWAPRRAREQAVRVVGADWASLDVATCVGLLDELLTTR